MGKTRYASTAFYNIFYRNYRAVPFLHVINPLRKLYSTHRICFICHQSRDLKAAPQKPRRMVSLGLYLAKSPRGLIQRKSLARIKNVVKRILILDTMDIL